MTQKIEESPTRRIWSIAGPSILASLSGATVGIVDIWAIGHLPDQAPLAGLAVGSFLIITLYMLFSFLYMSTVGLVAQSLGAKRSREMVEVVLRSTVLAVAFGIVIVLLSPLIVWASVSIWAPSQAAAEQARDYLTIRLLAMPAIFATMVVLGLLIGIQKARLALYLELLLNGLNVILTLGFVIGLGWQAAGAALGSLVAEWTAALLGCVFVVRLLRSKRILAVLRDSSFWVFQSFRVQLTINGFFLARTLCIQLVFAVLSVSGARLGDSVLAANHVLLQMAFVTSLGLVGMSSATQALVGEAKGAADLRKFHYWARMTGIWSGVVGLAFTSTYWIAGHWIIAAFTDVEVVRAAAQQQLLLIALWPVLAFASYQMDGIFIGATGAKQMLISASVSAVVFYISQAVLAPLYGNTGLWIAFIIFFLSRAVMLFAFYPALSRRVDGSLA